ncbi:hypothetical protein P3875_01230 [Myroides sp. JBRI-B21084]|uniref:hypothetical protein n=1 Tax=Myroides sp. JBRI-B21084 TaxID=3119977 RepID=UPI0026E24206|nr:hypothetical protein [Paenimyroides cloacae]WKW46723.1 hypothetical protein P3875_01230 [Paenimyroides cloacae]
MCCKIVISKNDQRKTEKVLYKVNEIEFRKSFKEFISKGSFTIPKNNLFRSKANLDDWFQVGDAIAIYWGYNGILKEEFTGYITRVNYDIPINIEFEDEMFKIKKLPVNFSSKNTSLENLLKSIIPNYEINVLEGVNLGSVRYANTTVGAVLDKLNSSDLNLKTWVDGKTVFCGKYYSAMTESPIIPFHLERNCVSTSLNYRRKEDIKVKIKAISTLYNGKKITVENIGDKDGNEVNLGFYNITAVAELKELAQKEYERFKQDRFDGSFTTFGTPTVKHGMKVQLDSSLLDGRNGIYYVEGVSKTFNINGIRQEITLGNKFK